MKQETRNKAHLHPLLWVAVGLSAFSAITFFVAMCIPPEGEVHSSILKGMSITTVQIALIIFAYAIVAGKTTTFSHGKTNVTVGAPKQPPPAETTE